MKIAYILPSRTRPESFFDTLNNIVENSLSDDYEIIAVLDYDDLSMNNDIVKDMMNKYQKVTSCWGMSKGKVHAINREIDKIPYNADIIIIVSDDQKFIVKGYDEIIRNDMKKYYPDLDGTLHYPDGSPRRFKLITMSIIGRKYFDRFGYLYYPEYISVYPDDEFTEVSKLLNKYKFIEMQIFKTNHWLWGTAKKDSLYERNDSLENYLIDGELFKKRREKNFYL